MSAVQPWPIGEPFPAAMTGEQLRRVLQLSERQFYRLKRAGKLKSFLIPHAVGPAIFSGVQVSKYVTAAPMARYGRGTRGRKQAA